MALIKELRESWGWIGLDPTEVVDENDFGNLIIEDKSNRYWRLCPEELSCEVMAQDREELDDLFKNQEFLHDWNMTNLVAEAAETLGPLPTGEKYSLKIPAVLGGEYGEGNLAIISLTELVRFSGDVAYQIKDLPSGTTIELKVAD